MRQSYRLKSDRLEVGHARGPIELVGDAEYVSDQIAIAAGQASSMGANVLNVVIPEPLSAAIQRRFDATVVPLERGDPWLVKSLGDSP